MSDYHVLKNASLTALNANENVVVIGSGAGGVIGENNFSIGKNSLTAANGAVRNIAIGNNSLYSNVTTNNLTAIGYQAMYSNTSGTGNIAVGYEAMYSNVSGNFKHSNGLPSWL